jgi:uncharacterized protein
VEASTAAVAAAGGAVLLPVDDAGPLGRLAIAADPTGAVFGLWQAGSHVGASHVNAPGGLTWEDLRSHDPDAARAFYRAVFGFDTAPIEMAGPDYQTFSLAGDDRPLGGMGGMMGNDVVPSHWLVYFGVADAERAVAAAAARGGTAAGPPFDTPYGRMATLSDPAGATFMLVENTAAG